MDIKSRMTPNCFHFVVDRSDRTGKLFDAGGHFRWAIPALAYGQDPDWHKPSGDTPPGLYVGGTLYEQHDRGPLEIPYGPFCLDLEDLDNQETGNGRSGISLHSGGSGCPDPFADYQVLLPTHGCVRVHNWHMVNRIVPAYKFAKSKGGKFYVTVQD